MKKNKTTLVVFQALFIGWMIAGAAFAEEAVTAAGGSEPEAQEAGTEAPAAPLPQPSSPGNVTIDFKDADIQNVIRILSYKSGVNIIAGKDVSGLVTIRLVDVPWEKALDVILKTYGYAYERDGNIVRIATLENLRKEELTVKVYQLNYSKAREVGASIADILSDRGRIRADERSNMLIVTDSPTTLHQIEKVVERLDVPNPQVVIHAKIIETTLGDADRIGIKWNVKAALRGSVRPTSFPFPATQRTALNRFLPDGRSPAATASSVGTSGATATTVEADFPSRGNQPTFPVADKADFRFGTLDFSEFQAILELIQERRDSKVLSEPHVTTLNNQEAKILVGEVISIPLFERNSTTGRMEITGYSDRDLGIRLTVKPQINSASEIVVDVHPEITNLLGYDDLTADIKAPRFSTREAVTQVRIKSGQTIVIGGLIRENSVDSVTKVPILGDLPLVGQAFRHTDKTVEKTDLLFFLTVNVVQDNALPQGHGPAPLG
jgi:type IV pilus secretin PilQ/predicted competence protein